MLSVIDVVNHRSSLRVESAEKPEELNRVILELRLGNAGQSVIIEEKVWQLIEFYRQLIEK